MITCKKQSSRERGQVFLPTMYTKVKVQIMQTMQLIGLCKLRNYFTRVKWEVYTHFQGDLNISLFLYKKKDMT